MSRKWNPFKQSSTDNGKAKNIEESPSSIRKRAIEDFEHLLQRMGDVEEVLIRAYKVGDYEERLVKTFRDYIETVDGLLQVVVQLEKECEDYQVKMAEYEKLKNMLANHHTILSDMQETHSKQIGELYAKKRVIQEESNERISRLQLERRNLLQEIIELRRANTQMQGRLQENKKETVKLRNQIQRVGQQSVQRQRRLEMLVSMRDNHLKCIDMNHLKLENVLYYQKLRNCIVPYLEVPELIRLKNTSKFYRYLVNREEVKWIIQSMNNKIQKDTLQAHRNIQLYEKVYELFPAENIKISALKYLFFKIKPGTYILSFLQENIADDPKPESTWKSLFTKKTKFNLTEFKNSLEFKQIEQKIRGVFGDLLGIKIPQDLRYYSESMERQLEQLKRSLRGDDRASVGEWAAQLSCLSKFLYMQMTELNNLLVAVFGQLVRQHRERIQFQQKYEQLRQNQSLIRSLVERVSKDKAVFELRIVEMEKSLLSAHLQRESLSDRQEKAESGFHSIQQQTQRLREDNARLMKQIESQRGYVRRTDAQIRKIQQELESLQNSQILKRQRKMSTESLRSNEQKHSDRKI